jgi:predicted HTH domain antitoxin
VKLNADLFVLAAIMKTLTINLPDKFDLTPKETMTLLAVKLYESGKLSLGQAAELAGYSKRTFMELLGNYNVSVFDFPPEDLDNDIADAI